MPAARNETVQGTQYLPSYVSRIPASEGLGVVRSLLQAVNCGLMVNSCPHHSYADRSTKAFPDRRTTRAERADPSGNADRCSSEGVRAADPVHPVSVFALCL